MIARGLSPGSQPAPNKSTRVLCPMICLLALSAARAEASSYDLTVLGTLRTDTTGTSEATGINNAGLVVGWAATDGSAGHVFRWTSSGGMTDEGALVVSLLSAATDVNSDGALCGFGLTQSNGFATAAHQAPGGALLDLPKPAGAGDSYGYSISDSGVVVGWTNLTSGCGYPQCVSSPGHAMKWSEGSSAFLPNLGGYFSVASAISNDGSEICGYGANMLGQIRGFRLHGTSIDELPPLAGFSESDAIGVDNQGDVVGYSKSGSESRATLWVGLSATDLGMLDGALSS